MPLHLITGAFGLDGRMLSGLTMLNLDTEDWGDIFIGCAGKAVKGLGRLRSLAEFVGSWQQI
jgi:hypothetical protein